MCGRRLNIVCSLPYRKSRCRSNETGRRWLEPGRLADRADIHRTYVGDIERGKRNPTVTVVEKLAGPLEVELGRLLD
ncbi:MAG: helix-turn-helix transcriptional regulator [Novosphingobium sp.]